MPKVPPEAPAPSGRDPLLDYQQAADYLGVTPRWLKRAVEEKRVQHHKLNRLVRFRQSALDQFLAANTVEAAS